MRKYIEVIFGCLVLAISGRGALAADLHCRAAGDSDKERLEHAEGIDVGGRDPNLSFTIHCTLEREVLRLAFNVRDDALVRTKEALADEDHLLLTVGHRQLRIYPGDGSAVSTRVTWVGAPAPGARASSSVRAEGWGVELLVPLDEVTEHREGKPIPFKAELADCDAKARIQTERTIGTSGSIVLDEGNHAFASFLKACSLHKRDIYFDRELTLYGTETARVLLASGKDTQYLAALSEEGSFVFIKMPWRAPGDLRDGRILDLAGDGRQALVFRYRERGSTLETREMLGIWRLPSESHIRRVFAAEVGRSVGSSRIENHVRFVRRGRANDLLIEAGNSKGFSAANYKGESTGEVLPILLPWSEDRRARYQFVGERYQRVESR
jgi:hypothetical protein